MAARILWAFKIAVKKLEEEYSSSYTCEIIRRDEHVFFPYPQHYVDPEGLQQTFTYNADQPLGLRDRLIFYGKTNGGRRKYSPEAHRFCARKGHAPELIAFRDLYGDWKMVVMDIIDTHRSLSPCHTGSYQQFSHHIPGVHSLERSITTLIEELHAEGYVHGDLRDVNLFVQVQDDKEGTIPKFMLVGFDWAGRINEAKYPTHINRRDIYRPPNARDGQKILEGDDLEMLRFLFHPHIGQMRKRGDEDVKK